MIYTTMTVGEKEYKLRMGATQVIELEKQLGGRNPLDYLMIIESGNLPPVTVALRILHAALQQFQHGLSFADVAKLYDQYVAEGGSYTELISKLVDVFRVSGFFPKAATEDETESL
jgi:hypothetical protein